MFPSQCADWEMLSPQGYRKSWREMFKAIDLDFLGEPLLEHLQTSRIWPLEMSCLDVINLTNPQHLSMDRFNGTSTKNHAVHPPKTTGETGFPLLP